MRTSLSVIVAVLAFSIVGSAGFGATYYVANGGNDGWPGSQSQPWLTLQKAVDTIAAGDMILVQPGTYAGCRMRYSGTSGAPKTLKANGAVLINAPGGINRRSSGLEIQSDDGSQVVQYWVIDGFEVTSAPHWGVDGIFADYLIVRNCNVHNNGTAGGGGRWTGIFSAYGNYVLIENNSSYSNTEHGIYVNNSADYGTLRGNVTHNNGGNGVHMNADLSMTPPGDGIMTGWTSDGNTSYSDANGGDADGVRQSLWKNCLAYNFGSKGYHFTGADGAINSRDCRIINCTYICSTTAWYPLTMINNDTAKGNMTGFRVFNNILFSYQDHAYRGSMCMSSTGFSDFQSDYNVVMGWFGIDDNGSQESLATWRARGYDVHSTQVATTDDVNIWVNPSGSDYHLKAASLAIDKGLCASPDVTKDMAGLSRPQGLKYDCGCYEYASGVAALDILTTSVPNGTLTVPYLQKLEAGGGVTPYTWSFVSGALPLGLTFDTTTATISGTPTGLGTFYFTIGLTDSNNPQGNDQQQFTITITALPLYITTPFMRDGYVGMHYSQNINQTGGAAPFTYSIVSGSLPTGTSLNAATGEISGSPTTAGSYTFTARVSDSQTAPFTNDKQFTIKVNATVPTGTWHYVSTAGSNTNPGTWQQPWATLQYAVDSCPNGDTIVVEPGTYIGCRIESSGTSSAPKTIMSETPWGSLINDKEPTRAKHASYFEVENFLGTVQYWTIDGFEVNGNSISTYDIDVRSCNHITVKNCKTYNAKRTGIFCGHVDYFSVINNLTYSNGEHGIYTSDSGDYGILSGNTMHDNVGLGHHMNGGKDDGGDGIMSYWTVEKNTSYSNTNGFDADGVEYTVWKNNLAYDNRSKGLHFTGGDGASNGAVNTRYARIFNNTLVCPSYGWYPLSCVIQTTSIPDPVGYRIFSNILYNYQNSFMRGTMCMSSKCLSDFQSDYNVVMAWFALDDNGTSYTTAQWQALGYDTHSVQVGNDQATRTALWVDSDNADIASKNFHLPSGSQAIDKGLSTSPDVNDDKDGLSRPQGAYWDCGCYEFAAAKVAVAIVTTSLPGATLSTAYSQRIIGSGGTAPYAWSITSGSLPAGLVLDTSYGTITGTPTTTGTSNFTIRLTDSTTPTAQTAQQALSIAVTALPLSITTPSLRNGNLSARYSQHLSATGGVMPYTWSVQSGSLPTGLSISGTTGEISGTPTATGNYTFTIRVTDSQSPAVTNSKSFTVVIGGALSGFVPRYVSSTGTNGNPGSYDQPWLTLQYAVDNCPPGGTIIVEPGTYVGFRIENSGTGAQPKTIMSETPGAAIINAKEPTRAKHGSFVEIEKFGAIISYWTVDGFTVHGVTSSTYCIDARVTSHISINNNIVDGAARTGIFGALSDYLFIDKNTSFTTGEHAIYVNNSSDYGICSRNLLYGTKGCGIHMNGDCTAGRDGIMSNWIIEKNVAYSNANGYDADGVDSSIWRNNLAWGNSSKGIQVSGSDSSIWSRNDRFVNNTLICLNGSFYPLNFWCDGSGSKPLPTGHRVFNNILFTYMDSAGRGSMCINSYMTSDFQSDYNVVNNWFALDDNGVTEQLAAWRTRGYDTHSVSVAATADTTLWADPANRNYHLAASSPALNAGTTLTDVLDDMDGTSRPQGAGYDIGCYETTVGGPAGLTITTASLPNALTNTFYTQRLAAGGGVSPYTWSVVSGTLPTGLGLDPISGWLRGTCAAGGASNFTIRASDSRIPAVTYDKAFSITMTAGTAYEKTFQNGLGGYSSWQDTWLDPDTPTTNHQSDTGDHLQYLTPDRQLHKADISSIPAGATINSATLSLYVSNNYSSTANVDLHRCITHWDVAQATYNNRLTGTAWGAAGMLAGTDYDAVPGACTGDVGSTGWISFDVTRLVAGWAAGSYANEGVMLKLYSGGHFFTYMADYSTDTTLRPKLVVSYTVSGGSSVSITTTSLPNGTTGEAYSQTLAATGGTAPYTWSVQSGGLPTGLTLNASTGVISGTPTAGGTSNFTVKVLDSVNAVATQPLSIIVSVGTLQVTTSSLAGGTVSVAYSQTLAASGGISPYTWSISAGSLPVGLSLVPGTGVISGTPTAAGTWSFTAQVTDSQIPAGTATKALSIAVQTGGSIPVSITTTSLPNGRVSSSYSQTLQAAGGQLPYGWSILSGSLPAGLSLNGTGGVISGTSTATGTSSFTIKITDSQTPTPATDSKALSIVVNAAAMTYYVATSGNDSWPGNSGQPWLTIQHAVDTVIGGDVIIVNAGTYAGARIRYSGSAGNVKTIQAASGASVVINTPGALCTKPSNLEVKADIETNGVAYWIIDGFEVTSSPNYGVEVQYGDHITVQNCKIHANAAQNLVAWYSNYCSVLSNETYSNTGGSCIYVGNSGDYNTIRGNSIHNAPSSSMFIASEATASGDRILSGYTIEKNICYSAVSRFMCFDGARDSIIRNNLAYGQGKGIEMLGNTGAITSTYNRVLNNTILCNAGGYYDVLIHRIAAGIPEGTNNTLLNNILYNYDTNVNRGSICVDTAAETGFQSDYNVVMNYFGMDDNSTSMNLATWRSRGHDINSVQGTDFDLFMNPSAADYHLKQTAVARDSGTMVTDVTDDLEGYARPWGGVYDIGCYEFHIPPITVTTTSLPNGVVNSAYSAALAATGGIPPYTWSIVYGSLPGGMSLNASTGAITGTPAGYGVTTFTVRATDSQIPTPSYDEQVLSITVDPATLTVLTTSLAGGNVGVAYSQTLAASGGVSPYSWSIAGGSLPAGLSLDFATGVISGTPTATGTSNFTVRVTDSATPTHATNDKALSIVIGFGALTITSSSLSEGQVGVGYIETLAATGGQTPYTWSVNAGTLPSGLSLAASTGVISGTPTAAGTSSFTIRVVDSQTPTHATNDKAFTIIVNVATNTYYVSTSGNDNNPGTQTQPWATLQKAVDTVVAGDTVIVTSGSYAGFRIEDKSGSPNAPITLRSQTQYGAIINSKNNRVYHGSMIEFEGYSPTINYWTVDGFEVDGTVQGSVFGYGIDMRNTTHMTVKNCKVHNANKTGIFSAFSDYLAVTNNISYSNGEHGIYNSNSGDYGINRSNLSYSNVGNGIQNNADVSMGGDGMMSYWTLEKNTLHDDTNGFNFPGLEYSSIRNNLVYSIASKGFSIYGGEAAECSNHLNIYNNTVLLQSGAYFVIFMIDDKSPAPLGQRVFNNILYHYGDAQGRGSICIPTASRSDFQSDYNVVGNWFAFDDGGTTMQLSTWRTYGYDTHSIQAADTALFVNPSGNDYHLKSTSPAKDAGTTLTEVSEDLEGMSRPQNSVYDIGCYEYVVEGVHPLSVTTTSLPSCDLDVAYSATLTASGGTSPCTWSISSGSLPIGLALDPATGMLSGTGQVPGTSNFTARVTDYAAATATKALSITVTSTRHVTFQDDLDGYAGTRDTWMTEDYPTGNFGDSDISHLQSPTQDRQLHEFDLSSIPSGATVSSATVSFYVMDLVSGTPTVACYRVIKHWEEMQATYNNATDTVAWGTPGMQAGPDYDGTALGATAITGTGFVSFDITGTVQGWVNGAYANEGVMYRLLSDGWARTFMREAAPEWWGHPMLQVVYTPAGGGGAVNITTTTLPNGSVGVAYSQPVIATGGVTPYAWSVLSGSLPAGLSLNTSTGVISGTPTTGGASNFTVRVVDSTTPTHGTDDQALSITVNVSAPTITTASLSGGTVGSFYSEILTATGGVLPYTWSIQSGSLPAGLTLTAATGEIAGTPTTAGTSNITVKVTDSATPTAGTNSKALSIIVDVAPLTITTASLPNAQVASSYNQTLAATGGVTPYTWSVLSGSLPSGLSLVASTGVISGTPTAYGTSNFTIRVVDSKTPTHGTNDKALSIVVTPAPLLITTSSLASGTVGVAYSQTLTATGGMTPYTWSILSGGLPAGLTLNTSTGVISGTPTMPGTSNFTARVTDSQTPTHATNDAMLSIAIVPAALTITTSSLPNGQMGVAYSQTVQASGGVMPYAWSISAGALPGGYSINSSTGQITGTTNNYGAFSFTVRVTDSQAPTPATYERALSITIDPAVCTIKTYLMPNGSTGVAYSCTLAAGGGTSPYTWSLAAGSLPTGLTVNSSTGAVTGTPTASGVFSFTMRATDSTTPTAQVDNKVFCVVIAGANTVNLSLQQGVGGYAGAEDTWLDPDNPNSNYATAVTAHLQYGTTDRQLYRWSLSSVPTGARINSATVSIFASNNWSTSPKVDLFRVLTHWDVAQTTYNNRLNGTPWGAAGMLSGTDYATPAVYTTGNCGTLGWISFDVTTLVANWANGSYANEGLMLKLNSSGHLYTRMADWPIDPAGRPMLVVNYTPPVQITTSSLPNGQVSVAYSQTLAATGGVPPYTWTLASGSLPSGLSLTSAGVISGTPTAYGASSFTVQAADSQGTPMTAQKALSITVMPATLTITTSSLPNGTVGVAYNQTMAATGGATPYTWSVYSGTLPSGLSINASTGVISGTPTASGTSNFTIRVADSWVPTNVNDKALSIVISPAGDATYQYAAADSESSTSSTSYQHKTTLTFTVNTADTYLILAMAEVKENNTSANVRTQVTIDGSVMQNTINYPKTTSDYITVANAKVVSLSAASHTLYLDYSSSSSSRTAYIRNARIVALRKASLELNNADQGDTGNDITTTMTNYVTTTFTPATAGDYLLIWSGSFTAATTSYYTTIENRLNGTSNNTIVLTNNNTGNRRAFLSANMVNLAASAQTMTIAASKSGGTSVHHLDRARVIAIRLAGSRFTGYQSAASDTEATTTSTAWQQKLTKSWSVGTAGNWLMLMSCGLADTSTTYNVQMQQQLDNATTEANPLLTTQAAANYMNSGCIDVRNLATGTRTVDVDYRSSNASGTAKIRNVRLIAVPLQ